MLRQDVGEPVALRAQLRIAEVANRIIPADAAYGEPTAAARQHMAVDRLMRDIKPAVGQPVEQPSRLRPRKHAYATFVILQVGADKVPRTFSDPFQFHRCARAKL